jgi:hypothetical protein
VAWLGLLAAFAWVRSRRSPGVLVCSRRTLVNRFCTRR